MSVGSDLVKVIADTIEKRAPAIAKSLFFIATVSSVDSGTKTVGILRNGASAPDTQLYRRGFGYDPSVSDEVLCLRIGGSVVVLCPIGVDAPGGAVNDEDVATVDTWLLLGGTNVEQVFNGLDITLGTIVDTINNHIIDAIDAHDASAVSFDATGLTWVSGAGNLQDILENIDPVLIYTMNHVIETIAAHTASAISFSDSGVSFSADDVQEALEELDNLVFATSAAISNHLSDSSDSHDASSISFTDSGNDYSASDVDAALTEVMNAILDHVADTTAAHAASAISFSPTGTISSTTVQAAIAEASGDLTTHEGAADPHTGYIKESEYNAGGDLLVGSGSNTLTKLSTSARSNRFLMTDHRLSGLNLAWRAQPVIHDHLIGASPPAGWTTALIGAASALTKAAGESLHPGILRMASAASTNTGHVLHRGADEILVGDELFFAFQFRLTSTAAAQLLRLGFFDSVNTSADVDALAFEIPSADDIRGFASSNSSVQATSTMYTSLATDTWYLAWGALVSGVAEFKLCDEDGDVLWSDTVSSSLPTGAGRTLTFGARHYTTNNTPKTLDIDYIGLWIDQAPAWWPNS